MTNGPGSDQALDAQNEREREEYLAIPPREAAAGR